MWLWIQNGGAFEALCICFGAGFTLLVSIALGSLICGKALKDWPVRFVVGAAVLSLAVFLLCCAQLAYPLVFALLGAAVTWVWIWRCKPIVWRFPRASNYLLAIIFAVYFVLYFFNAMAPEASPDGAGYHLGFVARYLREHGFHPITWNIYANLSEGAEMLFLFAFAFGKHSAAAMVHFAFLVALVCQMAAYARRAGFPLLGMCAGLLVFASPVVGIDASSAYNDVALACVAFTLFYLLQLWDTERSTRLLILVGLVAGFGYAVKYTAFLGVLYAIGFVAWKSRTCPNPSVGMSADAARKCPGGAQYATAIVAGCAAVMVLPWIVKDWLWVQNPLSPFFNHIFPNPYVTSWFESGFRQDLATYDLPSRWMIPWAVTVSGRLAGVLGPVFLLAPIALLSLRLREGRQLLLAAAVFGATYFSNIGARFLIAPLPFVALAMMLALGTGAFGRTAALALALAHAVICWPAVVRKYATPGVWALKKIPVRAALRLDPAEDYLQAHLVYFGLDEMIERSTVPGSTVFSFQVIPEAYTSRRILFDYESAGNHHDGLTLWTGFSAGWLPTLRARFTFDEQPLRGIRVVQTTSGGSPWRIHELRAFDGASPIPRNGWQVTANPSPWGIESAFDNNPVTFWECGDNLRPDMYVEADFAGVQQTDSVVMETSPNQPDLHLRLLGESPAGEWKTLAAAPEMSNVVPMDLRRAAVQELKRRGIGYLLLFDIDVAAADFRENTARWGVREVGQSNTARLYELQ